jgi:hypothetical protein
MFKWAKVEFSCPGSSSFGFKYIAVVTARVSYVLCGHLNFWYAAVCTVYFVNLQGLNEYWIFKKEPVYFMNSHYVSVFVR